MRGPWRTPAGQKTRVPGTEGPSGGVPDTLERFYRRRPLRSHVSLKAWQPQKSCRCLENTLLAAVHTCTFSPADSHRHPSDPSGESAVKPAALHLPAQLYCGAEEEERAEPRCSCPRELSTCSQEASSASGPVAAAKTGHVWRRSRKAPSEHPSNQTRLLPRTALQAEHHRSRNAERPPGAA